MNHAATTQTVRSFGPFRITRFQGQVNSLYVGNRAQSAVIRFSTGKHKVSGFVTLPGGRTLVVGAGQGVTIH